MIPKPIILLLSGGLDSTTLLYDLHQQRCNIHCLLFDYNQTHRKELTCALSHIALLNLKHTLIELHRIRNLFSHSSLTDGKGGDVVPNRNSVFCHIAASIAVSAGSESVAIACNKDDQSEFPDCRWGWVESTNAALQAAEIPVEVVAPYIGLTKWQIVRRAKELGVELSSVWWCYSGKEKPCGRCGACIKMKGLL